MPWPACSDRRTEQFELIAIDDGSTDETPDIFGPLPARMSGVRIISHDNMGMGRSLQRSAGDRPPRLDRANGCRRPDGPQPDRASTGVSGHVSRSWWWPEHRVRYIDADDRIIGQFTSPFDTTGPTSARAADENRLIFFHHPSVIMCRDATLLARRVQASIWPADDVDLRTGSPRTDPANPAHADAG